MRERSLQNITKRHVDMYVPSEFMRAIALWQDFMAGPNRVSFDTPVKFVITTPDPAPEEGRAPTADGTDAAKHRAVGGTDGQCDREGSDTAAAAAAAVAGVAAAAPSDEKDVTVEEVNASAVVKKDAQEEGKAPVQAEKATASGTAAPVPEAAQDWSKMTVVQLRAELTARGLGAKGVKADLVSRLSSAVEAVGVTDPQPMDVDPPVPAPKATETTPCKPASKPPAAAAAVQAEVAADDKQPFEIEHEGPDNMRGHWWSAKVLLVGGLPSSALRSPSPKAFIHPLQTPFLLRKRPKSELLLPGGAWSPEDGAHPADDPAALVATAIRCVRAQTGIDLTACTEWYKLLEVQYRRPSSRAACDEGHVQRTIVFVVSAAQVAEPNVAGLTEVQAAEVRYLRALLRKCSHINVVFFSFVVAMLNGMHGRLPDKGCLPLAGGLSARWPLVLWSVLCLTPFLPCSIPTCCPTATKSACACRPSSKMFITSKTLCSCSRRHKLPQQHRLLSRRQRLPLRTSRRKSRQQRLNSQSARARPRRMRQRQCCRTMWGSCQWQSCRRS
jgi:hypothetical protein